MIKCPYLGLELRVASLSMANKFEDYLEANGEEFFNNKLQEMTEKFQSIDPANKKQVAEFHSITVPELINSPNYKELKEEYEENSFSIVFNFIRNEFNLTDKETWAAFQAAFKS